MEQNQQAGLELNVSKSTTFFFSTASGEASWRPDITLLGEKMGFGDGVEENPPMFLGLRLDRVLCFQDHVDEVCSRVVSRCRMLSCLTHKS